MFPALFLALPLLMPISNPELGPRNDLVTTVPMGTLTPLDERATAPTQSGTLIPPLYQHPDGDFSLMLSPGSPCTAACLRLRGTF